MTRVHERNFVCDERFIEIQHSDGTTSVFDCPNDWTVFDYHVIRKLMNAVGWEVADPKTDALFAFSPRLADVSQQVAQHLRENGVID